MATTVLITGARFLSGLQLPGFEMLQLR